MPSSNKRPRPHLNGDTTPEGALPIRRSRKPLTAIRLKMHRNIHATLPDIKADASGRRRRKSHGSMCARCGKRNEIFLLVGLGPFEEGWLGHSGRYVPEKSDF
ncbi:hypothetical protein AVEN_69080-1 [Araneus ventricosus]|uniref:Uncharacterized protein n=1 Tax=Araneus ventricosus TaxID=182803 RepID=A0A4Y2QCV5_ARAVE|nr:hypothetical protein AVEN_69080-1 [Araneus ventricosus]